MQLEANNLYEHLIDISDNFSAVRKELNGNRGLTSYLNQTLNKVEDPNIEELYFNDPVEEELKNLIQKIFIEMKSRYP